MRAEEKDKLIKEGERLDDLERNNLKILQRPGSFCFGIDAVLLSSFARAREGEVGVDLGTGTGIIPILMSAKTKARHITGIELQEASADMAQRSIKYNELEDKIEIICDDLKNATRRLGSSKFNFVTVNPPYMNDNHGLKNPDEALAIARHEIKCTLEDVISQAKGLLKNNGRLYMVHRPHRLSEIMQLLKNYKLEPKRLRLVHPYKDKDANMVLIEAVKGGGAWLKVEPPIIVYEAAGRHTQEIYNIYEY